MREKVLIIAFSNITSDARVLRQVRSLSQDFDVYTCGYGIAPEGVIEHIEIPRLGGLPKYLSYALIDFHLYWPYYWMLPLTRWLRKAFRKRSFDFVIANDNFTIPFASKVKSRNGFLADLHEYFPLYRENEPIWLKRQAPYHRWICRNYVTRAKIVTTVNETLAAKYAEEFQFAPQVITNATPYAELEPKPVGEPIKIVHSGVASKGRYLENMITAVQQVAKTTPITFDLYLVLQAGDQEYIDSLTRLIAETPQVRIRSAVSYDELISTLSNYDVGVHILPPTNFNNRNALPNKLFDYVQARLGIITGPSPEMAKYVRRYRLGAVTTEFSAESLTELLEQLTAVDIDGWKQGSHKSAQELSAEIQVGKLMQMIEDMRVKR